jgi:hypothetical protein
VSLRFIAADRLLGDSLLAAGRRRLLGLGPGKRVIAVAEARG